MTAQAHAHLKAARAHVLAAVDGVEAEALRRAVLPSGWSCLDLLSHLTTDVERFWFRAAVAAEPDVVAFYEADPGDAWKAPADLTAAEIVAAYRTETERADAIIDATPGDAAPRWWPQALFGSWRLDDVDEIVLHVLVETATHAGQLDAVRELLDGHQHLVLS